MSGENAYLLRPEHEDGAYAEACASWHTPHSIVLEFLAPATPPDPEAPLGERRHRESLQVAARIRIPAGAAFDVIREVSDRMAFYEAEFGEIHRPQLNRGGAT